MRVRAGGLEGAGSVSSIDHTFILLDVINPQSGRTSQIVE